MTALGLGELCTQPEYATNPARMANRDALKTLMEEKLALKTTAEWEAELVPAGVRQALSLAEPSVCALALTWFVGWHAGSMLRNQRHCAPERATS